MHDHVRQNIRQMDGYVSGEQPQQSGWIKLNTNENPYPPSPHVVSAIQQAAVSRLNVYPDPRARSFRKAAAGLFGVDEDWILPANGSDENLTVIVRTFCDPGTRIAYPYPSYVLYETLAAIQDCEVVRIPLNQQHQWCPADANAARESTRICFVPNPNSPTGNRWTADQILELLPDRGVLVLDEAYGDFADTPHRGEWLHDERFQNRLIITRTLSKSYSLAGLRFGFAVANPALVSEMEKVKDSYNCDAISIAAATAAIEDQEWMLRNRQKIVATRNCLKTELPRFGFSVHPSQANFVWTTHESGKHREIYELLKQNRILVRFMSFPGARASAEGLRITIGTDDEVQTLLKILPDVMLALS